MKKSVVAIFVLCLGTLAWWTGCGSAPKETRPTAVARFLLEADENQPGLDVVLPVSGVSLRVQTKPVVTEFDIVRVAEAKVDLGRCVMFQFSPAAGRYLYRLSASHIGRRLVLVVNGQPIGVRVIDRPIEDGLMFIFLEVPDTTLTQLVDDLNYTTGRIQQEAAKQG